MVSPGSARRGRTRWRRVGSWSADPPVALDHEAYFDDVLGEPLCQVVREIEVVLTVPPRWLALRALACLALSIPTLQKRSQGTNVILDSPGYGDWLFQTQPDRV